MDGDLAPAGRGRFPSAGMVDWRTTIPNRYHQGVVVLVIVAWLGLAVAALKAADRFVFIAQVAADIKQIPPAQPPSPASLRALSFGFQRAASDVVWLSTIQYFGGGNPNEPYASLYELINTVVALDPDFEYPYLFGGIVLPWQGEPRQALDLLDRGASRFPRNGLIPYYAGAAARLQLKDNRLAARYFQQAVTREGAPPAAALLAGVSLTESDDREFALSWWSGVIDSAENETVKKRAELWRDHLRLVLYLEGIIREENNHRPDNPILSLRDLVQRGRLTGVPVSPLGSELRYNQSTGRVELIR